MRAAVTSSKATLDVLQLVRGAKVTCSLDSYVGSKGFTEVRKRMVIPIHSDRIANINPFGMYPGTV